MVFIALALEPKMQPPTSPRLLRFADIIDDGLAEAQAAHDAYKTGAPRGPLFPMSPRIEREIGGYFPVGITVMHGPPGSAKTALANQIAADCGSPALIVSLEMSPLVLLNRQAARLTNTYLSKFRSGELAPSEWLTIMRRTAARVPALSLLDGTRAPVSGADIRESAILTKGFSPHLLIVIDSINSWVRGSGALEGGASEYEAINAALTELKRLSNDIGAAVIVIAEQNRASMGSDKMDAAACSRMFEYVSELMIALSRDRAAMDDANGESPIHATLAKNRNGEMGKSFKLQFAGRFMAFRDTNETVSASGSGSGR